MSEVTGALYLEYGVLWIFDPTDTELPPEDFPGVRSLWIGRSSLGLVAQHGVDGEVRVRLSDAVEAPPSQIVLGVGRFTVTSGRVAASGWADWSVEMALTLPPGDYTVTVSGDSAEPADIEVVFQPVATDAARRGAAS